MASSTAGCRAGRWVRPCCDGVTTRRWTPGQGRRGGPVRPPRGAGQSPGRRGHFRRRLPGCLAPCARSSRPRLRRAWPPLPGAARSRGGCPRRRAANLLGGDPGAPGTQELRDLRAQVHRCHDPTVGGMPSAWRHWQYHRNERDSRVPARSGCTGGHEGNPHLRRGRHPVIDVPDPAIQASTDAVVRVRARVCGSDLHPYHSLAPTTEGVSIGHEFIRVVEEIGADVTTVTPGDFVIAPFAVSCGVCEFCRAGLQTSCVDGGFWNDRQLGTTGGQAEGGPGPTGRRHARRRSGCHRLDRLRRCWPRCSPSPTCTAPAGAAIRGGVTPGSTVTVIGDGAVGLLAVLSARQLGATRIVLMGRHELRTDLGREFGATDVVADRGPEDRRCPRPDRWRQPDRARGRRAHARLRAGGRHRRPGGVISRVGVPQCGGVSRLRQPVRPQCHPHRWPRAR